MSRDEIEAWILLTPTLRTVGVNNIQASISSLDIWNDIHRYATFGTRSWGLRKEALRRLISDKVSRTDVGYGLRGFFDADGSVKYQAKRSSRQVTATSVNWEGLQQISTLLGKIGIRHSVYEDSIAIFGRRNLLEYQKTIGFGIARENEALNNMISTFRVQ